MATYGGNSFAVMFQRTEQSEPLPENKSQALPAHRPNLGGIMPGGKEGKTSGQLSEIDENTAESLEIQA